MSRTPVARRDAAAADHLGGTTRKGLFSGSLASLLSVACGVGVSVALMDLQPRLLNLAPDFTWFRYVLLPATLSTIIIGLAYLMVLIGFSVALRLRGRRTMELAFGLAIGFFLAQYLFLFVNLRLDRSDLETLKNAAAVGAIAAVFGIGGWALLRRMDPSQMARRCLIAALQLAPLFALSSALLLHANRSFLGSITSFRSLIANAGAALALLGVFLWFVRRQRTRETSRLGLVIFVLLALATFSAGMRAHWRWQAPPEMTTVTDSQSDQPSVLLLTVDTLRADHLSCYRSSVATPALDSLARDGVLFERATAPSPWTVPSLASILTGLEPLVHGATTPKSILNSHLTTLAERLRESGYRTAALTDNPFVRLAGLGRGFQQFNSYPKNWGGPTHRSFLQPLLQLPLFPVWCRQYVTGREITDEGIAWLRNRGEDRFFLWLHYFDPHMPYSPPPEFSSLPPSSRPRIDLQRIRMGYDRVSPEQRSQLRTLYQDEVRFTDHSIGRLLDALRTQGRYDSTLIVFTSDHGEEFWEHGGLEHGHTLYDELLHVPLIIKPSPSRDLGVRRSAPVSITQLVPTILEVLNIDFEGSEPYPPSIAGHWREDRASPPTLPICASSLSVREPRMAVTVDGYKYIRWAYSQIEELYHLPDDPMEQRNLAFAEPEIVARCREILDSYRTEALDVGRKLRGEAATHQSFDPNQSEQLKALGYVE